MFPDRAQAAHWFGEDSTCVPPRNSSAFTSQIKLRDQYTWVAQNTTAFGVHFLDTTITSRLPGVQPRGLQLTRLFDDPYTPLNTISWVSTPQEFMAHIARQREASVELLRLSGLLPAR